MMLGHDMFVSPIHVFGSHPLLQHSDRSACPRPEPSVPLEATLNHALVAAPGYPQNTTAMLVPVAAPQSPHHLAKPKNDISWASKSQEKREAADKKEGTGGRGGG